MANPRNDVVMDGIAPVYATFKIDNSTITYSATATNGSSVVGRAVAFSAANTVELAGDGEEIAGQLISVSADNKCVVQVKGVVTLPGGTGAALTVGKKIVGDLLVAAEGYIREVATGTAAELGVARGMILDASTTTAVKVLL